MATTTKSRKATGSKGSRAVWEKWAEGLEIREVAADSVEFLVNRARLASKPQPTVQVQYRLDSKGIAAVAGTATMLFEFELLMTEQGEPTPPPDPLLRVRLTYQATYSLPDQPPADDEKLERFQKRIAAAHVFPFVRAQVADLIARAGLPPLYLPLAHPGSPPAR